MPSRSSPTTTYLSATRKRFNKSTLRFFVLSQDFAKFLPLWAPKRIFLPQFSQSSVARARTVLAVGSSQCACVSNRNWRNKQSRSSRRSVEARRFTNHLLNPPCAKEPFGNIDTILVSLARIPITAPVLSDW